MGRLLEREVMEWDGQAEVLQLISLMKEGDREGRSVYHSLHRILSFHSLLFTEANNGEEEDEVMS